MRWEVGICEWHKGCGWIRGFSVLLIMWERGWMCYMMSINWIIMRKVILPMFIWLHVSITSMSSPVPSFIIESLKLIMKMGFQSIIPKLNLE